MVSISVDQELKNVAPDLTLGVACASVSVSKCDGSLWKEIERRIAEITSQIKLETIGDLPEFKALRDVYRALGKDPTRYRGSAEALARRILQGKCLYQINTVVDINNLVSLETLRSVGSYNLANLKPPLVFRIGEMGEMYRGIGKDIVNIAKLPVFSDELGPFGSPTSDSERAMITIDTRDLMMVIISFTGSSQLQRQLGRVADLLRTYAKATEEDIETFMVGQ